MRARTSQIMMIGGLCEGSILALWWVSRMWTSRKHQRLTSDLQQEINLLRHALSEMALERHHTEHGQRRRHS